MDNHGTKAEGSLSHTHHFSPNVPKQYNSFGRLKRKKKKKKKAGNFASRLCIKQEICNKSVQEMEKLEGKVLDFWGYN